MDVYMLSPDISTQPSPNGGGGGGHGGSIGVLSSYWSECTTNTSIKAAKQQQQPAEKGIVRRGNIRGAK